MDISPKEVSVYNDDTDKPVVGEGLNKRAIVKLDGYWPANKTTRELITDPDQLAKINYVATLKRCTERIGAKFHDYIPLTGTCVFEVSELLLLFASVQ